MFKVTTEVQKFFFDRQKINDAIDREKKRALSRAGAFVRRRQRSSIKRRKSVSQPGRPPHSHTKSGAEGRASIKRILFGYSPIDESVFIGMVKVSSSQVRGDKPLPGILEDGGWIYQPKGTYVPQQGRDDGGRFTEKRLMPLKKARRLRIKPRSSAVPALEKETDLGNVIKPWKGVLRP